MVWNETKPNQRHKSCADAQVAMYETTLMDCIYRLNKLCHVEFGLIDREFVLFLHVGKEIPTFNAQLQLQLTVGHCSLFFWSPALHELHDQVQIPRVLEGAEQIRKPNSKAFCHGIPFIVCLKFGFQRDVNKHMAHKSRGIGIDMYRFIHKFTMQKFGFKIFKTLLCFTVF